MQNICKKIVVVFILFLTGCAHFQPQQNFQHISWKKREAKLQQNKSWVISGLISVTYNQKRDMAHFEWAQNQNNYTINISGPMNLNSVQIIGNKNEVRFYRSNNKCVKAKTPEKLFFDQLGWWLPISSIRYWIFALPAPAKTNLVKFDKYGHLVFFEQHGWKINYFDFQSANGMDLPSMIELKNDKFFIKLKLKRRSLQSKF